MTPTGLVPLVVGAMLATTGTGFCSAQLGTQVTLPPAQTRGRLAVPAGGCEGAELRAFLKASNAEEADFFGISVSSSGDTLVVGASAEDSAAIGIDGDEADNSAAGSGAVYVFVKQGTTWVQQAYLKASNAEAGDSFGSSVSLSGDTLAVGAPWEDSSAAGMGGNQNDNAFENAGAAYVFERVGTTWRQTAYIKPSNPAPGSTFGNDVSVDGDSLCVGASGHREGSNPGAGAAYAFGRTGGAWREEALWVNPTPQAFENFGRDVVASGDTMAVGTPFEDSVSYQAGAVHVYRRAGGAWGVEAELQAPQDAMWFGFSIDLVDDTLLCLNGFYGPAEAVVFTRSGSAWSLEARLFAPIPLPAYSGASVSLSNDTAVLGTCQAPGSTDPAASFVFTRDPMGWTPRLQINEWQAGGVCALVSGDTLLFPCTMDESPATGVDGDMSGEGAPYSGAVRVYEMVTPAGTNYCTATPNSTGLPGRICALGSPDVSSGNLTLQVADTPPTSVGVFVFGNGQAQIPLGDGFLCVGNRRRLNPPVRTNSFGLALRPLDFASEPLLSVVTSQLPSRWNFQFWHRDEPGRGNLTDAVTVDLF